MATCAILLIVIVLTFGEKAHSQLIEFGQDTWDDYFLLRGAAVIQQPTCDRNPDIDSQVAKAVKKKQDAFANDPLAEILGFEVDEDPIRRAIIGAAEICAEKHRTFDIVEARVTPGVKAFRTLEQGVQLVVKTSYEYKRVLLAVLVLLCASSATFARRYIIALRSARTAKDHYIATSTQLLACALLLLSATLVEQSQFSVQQIIQPLDVSVHALWVVGFTLLTLANLYYLFRPPKDLKPGGSWGAAFLAIPLYSLICLLVGKQFFSVGYYHGTATYLGMAREVGPSLLSFALYIWIGMLCFSVSHWLGDKDR